MAESLAKAYKTLKLKMLQISNMLHHKHKCAFICNIVCEST